MACMRDLADLFPLPYLCNEGKQALSPAFVALYMWALPSGLSRPVGTCYTCVVFTRNRLGTASLPYRHSKNWRRGWTPTRWEVTLNSASRQCKQDGY